MTSENRLEGACITREQFLMREMRIVAQLRQEGLGDEAVVERVASENLIQYPTDRMVRNIASVCVNQAHAALAAELLGDSDVEVCVTVAFPLGASSIYAKVQETRDALDHGAQEVDYVVNVTRVRAHDWDYVQEEMASIVAVCHEVGARAKVIFENCYLSSEEKVELCRIASEVGIDFVKTSTGFGSGGATPEDVRLMRENTREGIEVKAAGGIRTADDALTYLSLGATRLGCSAGIPIIEELGERLTASGEDAFEV